MPSFLCFHISSYLPPAILLGFWDSEHFVIVKEEPPSAIQFNQTLPATNMT
jgi:hypothetical protein